MQLAQNTTPRPHVRRALRRAVNLRCFLMGPSDRPLACRATDLSPCGIRLETSATIEPGEQVVLSFQPPRQDEELIVFATVARVHRGTLGNEVGLAFRLGAADRCALEACLRGLPPPLPIEPD